MKAPEKLKPHWNMIPKFYRDLGIEAYFKAKAEEH